MYRRMKRGLKGLLRDSRGQGMTEYIIIVALIAIAAIGVVTLFGDNIRGIFAAADTALSGEQNVTAQTTDGTKHQHSATLKDFATKNAP